MKKLNMDSWREMFYEKIEEVKPQDHWDLKMDQNLDYNDLVPGWKQSLQEHSFASFQWSRCQHFWSSVQVVILFHMYLDQHRRKGWVKIRVFRQLEEPNFKEESVQRVLENLVISIREKCYGEYVAQLSEVTVIGRHYGPHRSDHCEACLLGIHQRPKHTMYYGRPKDTLNYGTSKHTMPPVRLPSHDLPQDTSSCDFKFCCVFCIICILIFICMSSWNLKLFKYWG
ncbi:receptor-transporting protein 1-like isoform X1 [Gopherus flavomarginatus]|uniref:receptor-transporting protein 1-like isoform X1 n=1 Tax=Gopherus flavomarginatus TaxID=286002 RepID=UPI0021CC3DF1|nr:receptor-transporting protein 1-like isoform X1 [Gopherus flavomarginatus]